MDQHFSEFKQKAPEFDFTKSEIDTVERAIFGNILPFTLLEYVDFRKNRAGNRK